jgi:hypothetical protein
VGDALSAKMRADEMRRRSFERWRLMVVVEEEELLWEVVGDDDWSHLSMSM